MDSMLFRTQSVTSSKKRPITSASHYGVFMQCLVISIDPSRFLFGAYECKQPIWRPESRPMRSYHITKYRVPCRSSLKSDMSSRREYFVVKRECCRGRGVKDMEEDMEEDPIGLNLSTLLPSLSFWEKRYALIAHKELIRSCRLTICSLLNIMQVFSGRASVS